MNPPKNQKAEVLYELLTKKSITVRDILLSTGILNPKARISELRNEHFLPIKTQTISVENKYGRKAYFGQWSLDNKTLGIQIYKQINL